MADARYIIDVILRARDHTNDALASATRGIEDFRAENEKTARDVDESTRKMQNSLRGLEESTKRVSESQARLGRESKHVTEAKAQLEDATRDLVNIEKEEAKTLREQVDLTKRRQEGLRDVRATHEQLITVLQKEANLSEADAKRQATRLQNDRLAEHRTREMIKATQDLTVAREKLGKTFDPIAQREYGQAIERNTKLMRSLGMEGKEVDRIHKEAFNTATIERHTVAQRKAIDQARQYAQTIQKISELERRRADTGKDLTGAQRVELELDDRDLRRDAERLATELKAIFRHIEATVDFDSDPAGFSAIMAMKELIGKDVHFDVEADVGQAIAQMALLAQRQREVHRDGNLVIGLVRTMQHEFQNTSQRIAAFDNVLRGLASIGIAAFLNQIVLLAGMAAGGLMALASSAVYAGGALGGALVAGVAQAIPALGALAMMINRVSGVFKAVQQASLLQQQQSYQGAGQAKKEADSADALRGAQQNVAAAHERVAEAQRRLTEARRSARRELEDLILAEKEATLAAKGAVLSQEEAQAALARAVREGRTSDVQRAELAVQESDIGAQRAGQRATRSTEDLQIRRTEGDPGIRSAEQGLTSARRAVEDADRALSRARRSAEQAGAGMTAAAGKLNYMLAQMSASERRLYDAATRLQKVWRETSKTIAGPMVDSFTFMVKRITTIIQNPELVRAMTGLSARMGTSMRRVFSAMTDQRAMGQWMFFIAEARRNMLPLERITIGLGRAFMGIGQAAAPALRRILDGIAGVTKRFGEFTSSVRGQTSMKRFFDQGVTALGAWVKLLGSVARLFLAIAGPGGGAKAGVGILNDMTNAINRFSKAIETPGTKANLFFNRFMTLSRQMLRDLGPIFTSIGKEFDKTFNQDGRRSLQGFVQLIANVLIPAFGKFIRGVGAGVAAVGRFTEQHPGFAKMAAAALAMFGAFSVAARIGALFAPLIKGVEFLLVAFLRSSPAALRFAVALRAFAGPIALITTGIVFLLQRFGLLDDVMRGLRAALSNLVRGVRGPFNELIKTFKELFDALGSRRGIMPLLRSMAEVIVKSGLIPGIKLLAAGIGNVLGGALKIISGVLKIVIGILTGDWKKAWDGVKTMVSGVGRIAQGIIQGILAPFRAFGGLLVGMFRAAWNAVKRFFGVRSPSTLAMSLGKSIVDGIGDALKSLGRIILTPFRWAWDRIKDGWRSLKTFFTSFDFGDAFRNLGNSMKNGFKVAINWVIGKINWMIDQFNKVGSKLPGASKVKIDRIDFVKMQRGGRVGAGYGGGDRVPVLAEEGEYVVRKEAVSKVGLSVMAMINALGGGGGRIGGRLFQTGGQVRGGPKAGAANVGHVNFEEIVEAVEAAGDKSVKAWRGMWSIMRSETTKGVAYANTKFSELARNMGSKVGNAVTVLKRNMGTIKSTIFDGMSYVAKAVNDGLKAFGVDPIKLSVTKPTAGGGDDERRAVGGFIGQPGERGQDMIRTWLGRGEAVLNWGQQRMLDALLPGQHTLASIIGRTSGFHAGGIEQPGFAKGFLAPVSWQAGQGNMPFPGHEGVNRAIIELVRSLSKKYRATITDGYGPGHESPGHTETGMAVDFVPGGGGNWDLIEAMGKWAVKRGFTVGYGAGVPGSHAWPDHGRDDHIHIDFGQGGNLSAASIDIPEIKDMKVGGTAGKMRELVQAALNKVTGAARKYMESQMPTEGDASVIPGDVYHGKLDRVFPRGSSIRIEPEGAALLAEKAGLPGVTYAQLAKGESGFRPGAVSPDGGYGLWQMTPRVQSGKTVSAWNAIGSYFNPWNNARQAKYLAGSGTGVGNYYGDQFKTGDNLHYHGGKIQGLARGGFVGGRGFATGRLGSPLPAGAQAAVNWAKSQLGVREMTENWSKKIREYLRTVGIMGPEQWCGAFVASAAEKGGAKPTSRWAYVPSIVTDAQNKKGGLSGWLGHQSAKPGDLWIRGDSGHVEMVEEVLKGLAVRTIGGNTSTPRGGQGVARKTRGGARGYARPAYPAGAGEEATTGGTAAPKAIPLLSYEAVRDILPASLQGAGYDPTSTEYKGWFTNSFGVDPNTVRTRYGAFAGIINGLWQGVSAWTTNMVNAFRARAGSTAAGAEGEEGAAGPAAAGLPQSKGTQAFQWMKSNPFVNMRHRPVTGGVYRGKASLFNDARTASGRHGGISSHLGLALGGYWLLKSPNGKVAIWRQNDNGPNGKLERLFDLTPEALRSFPGSGLGSAGVQAGWAGMFLGNRIPKGMRTGPFSGIPGFAAGGVIGGDQDGQPVGIIAHAGEMVLNKLHQAKLGGATYLRKILGFTGDPTSFQGGGEVPGGGLHPGRTEFLGDWTTMWQRIMAQVRAGVSALPSVTEKGGDLAKAITGVLGGVTGEGGLLDQMKSGFESFSAIMASQIQGAVYAIDSAGNAIRKMSPLQVAQANLDLLKDQYDMLLGQRGLLDELMTKAQESLKIALAEGNAVAERAARTEIANLELRYQQLGIDINNAAFAYAEAQMQMMQDEFDLIQAEAQRSMTGLDLLGRGADIRERLGDPVGAAKARGAILQDRGPIIEDEIKRLNDLLERAQAAGNEALANAIMDQISELEMQLEENELAIRENTVAIRQAKIDLILGRAEFRTGVFEGITGIFEKIGEITGTTNIAAQKEYAERTGEELTRAVDKLEKQLDKAYDVDLRGLHGEALANAIGALNFSKIEKGMIQAEKDQFEALINAILEQENALLDNTKALNDLNGELREQNFQTTAWQWFRQAIFTGSGGLMPQYQIPSMQTGGQVTKSGLFNLHAGEHVLHPDRNLLGDGGDVNVTIDHPIEVADPTYMSERIAWKLKHTRR